MARLTHVHACVLLFAARAFRGSTWGSELIAPLRTVVHTARNTHSHIAFDRLVRAERKGKRHCSHFLSADVLVAQSTSTGHGTLWEVRVGGRA
eukprot:6361052-Prymnesium_polylepis.2